MDGLLLDLIETLPSVASGLQIIGIAYLIRAIATLSKEMSSLHSLVGQQTDLLGPEDPLHPGARLIWGVGVNSIEQTLGGVSDRLRTLADRQVEISDIVREIRSTQGVNHTAISDDLSELNEHAKRAIAIRQELVG